MERDLKSIGFWSALSTSVFAIIYIIPQLIQGIDMPETQKSLVWILTPSLFLAPSFLVMMVAVHYHAGRQERIWSHIGLLFALAYFVFVSIVYFTVLTVTMPHNLAGEQDSVSVLQYIPKSFLSGIDALGYTTMSLATLFAFPVFKKNGLEKWIRWAFLANGVIAPIILLTQVYPLIAYLGASWIITLPASSILVALFFRRATIQPEKNPALQTYPR
jgi:hypothetical protein